MPVLRGESAEESGAFGLLRPLGFVKSSKFGLPDAPIGICGVPPNTLFPGVNPPNFRTFELRRTIVIGSNSSALCVLNFSMFCFPSYDQWSFENVRFDVLRPPIFDDVRELQVVTRYYEPVRKS